MLVWKLQRLHLLPHLRMDNFVNEFVYLEYQLHLASYMDKYQNEFTKRLDVYA